MSLPLGYICCGNKLASRCLCLRVSSQTLTTPPHCTHTLRTPHLHHTAPALTPHPHNTHTIHTHPHHTQHKQNTAPHTHAPTHAHLTQTPGQFLPPPGRRHYPPHTLTPHTHTSTPHAHHTRTPHAHLTQTPGHFLPPGRRHLPHQPAIIGTVFIIITRGRYGSSSHNHDHSRPANCCVHHRPKTPLVPEENSRGQEVFRSRGLGRTQDLSSGGDNPICRHFQPRNLNIFKPGTGALTWCGGVGFLSGPRILGPRWAPWTSH